MIRNFRRLYPNANAFHLSGKTVLDSRMAYLNEAVHMGLPGISEFQICRALGIPASLSPVIGRFLPAELASVRLTLCSDEIAMGLPAVGTTLSSREPSTGGRAALAAIVCHGFMAYQDAVQHYAQALANWAMQPTASTSAAAPWGQGKKRRKNHGNVRSDRG